jgi:hypothetical protein
LVDSERLNDGKIDRLTGEDRLMELLEGFTADTPDAECPSIRLVPSLRWKAQ